MGIAVSAQTFYSFVLENLRNLGALKAMGPQFPCWRGLLLLQAFAVGLVGYGIGVGLTALFGLPFTPSGSRRLFSIMPPLTVTGIAVIVICMFAALLGILKVSRLETAIVFRA